MGLEFKRVGFAIRVAREFWGGLSLFVYGRGWFSILGSYRGFFYNFRFL